MWWFPDTCSNKTEHGVKGGTHLSLIPIKQINILSFLHLYISQQMQYARSNLVSNYFKLVFYLKLTYLTNGLLVTVQPHFIKDLCTQRSLIPPTHSPVNWCRVCRRQQKRFLLKTLLAGFESFNNRDHKKKYWFSATTAEVLLTSEMWQQAWNCIILKTLIYFCWRDPGAKDKLFNQFGIRLGGAGTNRGHQQIPGYVFQYNSNRLKQHWITML